MVGLFQTFDLLEASMETNQVSAIFEGLKISSITFVTGVIVISSVYVIFHSIKKGS
jgi:predicted nucleic-acid-binding protein